MRIWARFIRATRLSRDFFDVKVLIIGAVPILDGALQWVSGSKTIHWNDLGILAASYVIVVVGVFIWKFIEAPEEIATDEERNSIVQKGLSRLGNDHVVVLRRMLIVDQMTAYEAYTYLNESAKKLYPNVMVDIRGWTQLLIYNSQTTCYEIKPALKAALRKALKKRKKTEPETV